MASRHFWIPEYEITLKPLMASRDIVRGLQTLHDIEFTQEAQDIFEDAFRLVIEECADEREGAVEEVTDSLQEEISRAKSEMEEMVADHADQNRVLTSEHRKALEDLATAHRDEIARLQADHEAHILDLEIKHKSELLRAKIANAPRICTVEGHTVLVRRRGPRPNAWTRILSSEE